jgi:hypothetical protein
MLVLHQDGRERACPVGQQEEGGDGIPCFPLVGDPETVIAVGGDHGVRLKRYGAIRDAELQELRDFSA